MRRPPLPWATIAGVAALGVLMLAFFHARAGGTIGLVVALLISAALGITALVLSRSGAAPRLPRRLVGQAPSTSPARPVPLRPPPLTPAPPGPPLSGPVAQVAAEIARNAISQLSAPASSVLITREGRLSAAGSAGDWAAARRNLKTLAGPGPYDAASDGGDPPEFTLDPRNDWLPRLLALYDRPVPMERWQELSDVPGPLLPLVGLAASGVGVAIPVTHRRRLAGLWLLARRGETDHYTDAELTLLHRLARDAGRPLAEALDR